MGRLRSIIEGALRALLLPLMILILSPFILIQDLFRFFEGLGLWVWFKSTHGRHGKTLIFVTSEDPSWQPYIAANIIPRIEDQAIILDYKNRPSWHHTRYLEFRAFKKWAEADRDYNPVAIVFRAFGRVECVRFFKAFKEYNDGRGMKLNEAEERLFTLLN